MRKAALLSITLAAIGCGGGSSNNPDMGSGGMDLSGGGGTPDLSSAAMVNTGTQVMQAAQFFTLTSDDQAVAFTGASGGVSAVDIAGGTPVVIDAKGNSAAISGKVVFSWALASASVTTTNSLSIWKKGAAMPSKVTLAAQSFAGPGGATADGNFIAYADNSIDGSTTDLFMAHYDGTGTAVKIAGGVDTANQNCPPSLIGAATKIFAQYCPVEPADMGTPKTTLVMIDASAATPAPVILSTDVSFFGVDKAADKLFYIDTAKTLWYTALPPAGAATQVDTGVNDAVIAADGSALVWATAAGSFKKAAVTALSTPVTISGIKTILGISPDEMNALVADAPIDPTTFTSNISLLTAAGTATPLVTNGMGILYGPAFTTDSKFATYYDNPANGLAPLHAAAIAGGNPIMVADGVWNHAAGVGSKVVYTNNCKGCSNTSGGKVDYFSVDLSGGMPTLIVNQAVAPNTVTVSSDKSKVVYDFQPTAKPGPKSGVYVAPIP